MESINADRLVTTGDLFLRNGFTAAGTVRLLGAKIGSGFECDGANMNGSGVALFADSLEATTGIFLRNGFTAAGTVRLVGAKIGGDLSCVGAMLTGDNVALFADGMEVGGAAFLRDGFTAAGSVRLIGAKIGGVLDCCGAKMNGQGVALFTDRIEINGSVYFRDGFSAAGTVRMLGAKIGGNIEFDGAMLNHTNVALNCAGIETKGNVFLRDNFAAAGAVWLHGAVIGGDLGCRGGRFMASDYALICQSIAVDGRCFFDSSTEFGIFISNGTIDLTDARFDKTLYFDRAILSCANQAIAAGGLNVGAKLSFNGAQIAGPVSITSADIGGDISNDGASFEKGLAIERSRIGGIFFWRSLKHFAGNLSLDQSTAEAVSFDEASWAKPRKLEVDGFTYERFQRMPDACDSDYWVDQFLGPRRRTRDYIPGAEFSRDEPQKSRTFRPHAHGQLAKVLAEMGHEKEARAVNVAKRELLVAASRRQFAECGGTILEALTIIWNYIVGLTIDHGYRPGKAILWMVAIWFVWTLVFYTPARHAGIMTPTHPLIFKEAHLKEGGVPDFCRNDWNSDECRKALYTEYSEFYAPTYSLDVLVPIINFRQQDDWAPRVVKPDGTRDWIGWTVRFFEWVQTGLGWLLSLLLVSGVTGIIRRD